MIISKTRMVSIVEQKMYNFVLNTAIAFETVVVIFVASSAV